jgi:hypothetical protein
VSDNLYDDSGFVRGAFRILACEDAIAELIESAGDILAIDEDFRVRPGIYEIGASRTGIQVVAEPNDEYYEIMQKPGEFPALRPTYQYSVKTMLVEQHPTETLKRWHSRGEDKLTTLIAMMQKRDGALRTYVFNNAQLMAMDMGAPWRGEGMAHPAQWEYRLGTIMETKSVDAT